MGLTENRASGLLALNGLDVHPNSAVYSEATEVGLAGMVKISIVDEVDVPDKAREFACGLAKRAYGFQRESVGRA
jgi:hypothetical protein